MLWLTKRVIFGVTNNSEIKKLNDINKSEIAMLVTLAFLILFFGFYPLPLMETFSVSVNSLINNYETASYLKLNMINNLNIMLPEINLSLSIFSIL